MPLRILSTLGFAGPGRMSLKSSFRRGDTGVRAAQSERGKLPARAAKRGGEGEKVRVVGFLLGGLGPSALSFGVTQPTWGRGGDDRQIHFLSS